MDEHPSMSGQNLASLLIADYWQKLNIAPTPADSLPAASNKALLSRAWTFAHYIKPILDNYVTWFEQSKEQSNFTYQLTELNEHQLAGLIDVVTDCGIGKAREYFSELKTDTRLSDHVNRMTLNSALKDYADLNQGYGRRLGWYAMIRATKPRVVVETGVDKGLGSCVIASALLRNRTEGFPGKYFGTDINPQAGYLFTEPYASAGQILYGDSIDSLKKMDEPIDLFINDSDHSAAYEANEYVTVHGKLSYRAVVLGDNSHISPSLFEYATSHHKKYLFFSEKPKDHFYPGAGIGICY